MAKVSNPSKLLSGNVKTNASMAAPKLPKQPKETVKKKNPIPAPKN